MPKPSIPRTACSTAARVSPAPAVTRSWARSFKSPGHQAAIAGGLAHFTGLPHVTVDGDTAVVISYLQILTPKKSGEEVEVPNHGASRGYHIHRVVTNRWDLVRTSSGWKIKRRTLRLVDGSEPSRDILRGAFETLGRA